MRGCIGILLLTLVTGLGPRALGQDVVPAVGEATAPLQEQDSLPVWEQAQKAAQEGAQATQTAQTAQKAATSPDAPRTELRFEPPFDFPMTFAGNFGELRANHFHGGLDFKTQGVSGKDMRALGTGYISRIRVTHGSGYVLDVAYANGYSTTCRHLSAFVGEVAKRVKALQYAQESWEVDLTPEPDEYPVRAGQVIAKSGNTGYSFGPHLHLDVIEQATGDQVDPLPFFNYGTRDHTAPRAEGILLLPQPGQGAVEGKRRNLALPARPGRAIAAWGTIGVALKAYDYMDGAANKLGVHTVILEVDGVETFRSVVDRFAPEETRYINAWTVDGYMKSYIEPGCRLRMLRTPPGTDGLLTIDEERPYHLVYTLRDASGNTSHVRLTLQGRRMDIAPVPHDERQTLHWDRPNVVQEPGMELVIPRGRLYRDARLDLATELSDSAAPAYTYRLSRERIYLHDYAELSIGLRRRPVADSTKYYVAAINPRGGVSSVGGQLVDGRMQVRVRELTAFTVRVDTVPPVLTAVNPAGWGRSGRIVLKARDAQTGIHSYRATIDGQYALMGRPNSIQGDLVCVLDPEHVSRGQRHELQVTVADGCGNQTTETYHFRW